MQTHPENTLAAFREAIRVGAHMIELDVHLTKDHVPVVIHDATVDRTTNGNGLVADLTLAQIQQLDAGTWKDSRYPGERIPTLRQALEMMPLNVWLNLHLKGGAHLARAVAVVVAEEGRLHQAFLGCSNEAAEAARAAESRIVVSNLDRRHGSKEYVDETIAMKMGFIQLLGAQREHVSYPDFVKRLKRNNVRINYCCIDDPAELHAAFSEGIDFPIVDNIHAAIDVARGLGIEPLRPVYRSSGKSN